jgi:hypothetical protein
MPSLYPATSVTFGCLATPDASEEAPKIDAIGSDRGVSLDHLVGAQHKPG